MILFSIFPTRLLLIAISAAVLSCTAGVRIDHTGAGGGVNASGGTSGETSGNMNSGGSTSPPASTNLDCANAAKQQGSAGCTFYATQIPISWTGSDVDDGSCYVLFVVNPGTRPAKIQLDRDGGSILLDQVARIPQGSGSALTYLPFDPAAGLAPKQVALLFLSGNDDARIPCPAGIKPATLATTAVTSAVFGPYDRKALASGLGKAFRLTSDQPLIAYQMLPYSGGDEIGTTSSTLLLAAESWGLDHVVMTPTSSHSALVLVTAGEDGTEVSLQPTDVIRSGDGVPATQPSGLVRVKLNAGEFVQFAGAVSEKPGSTDYSLSGSVVKSNKPVSVIGAASYFVSGTYYSSAHQQILPIAALGHEYVAVSHKARSSQPEVESWQIVGVVDGTTLTYLPAAPAGAPQTLMAGQMAEFATDQPFVVRSHDANHPFQLSSYMTGWGMVPRRTDFDEGDPEFVQTVATDQFMRSFTLFTDPTYHDTSLVIVRKPGDDGQFADVKLGCATGPVAGWQPVGGAFEFARVTLVTDYPDVMMPVHPIPGCDTGYLAIDSKAPFSVTVWGWSSAVSYAYLGGASLRRINDVVIP